MDRRMFFAMEMVNDVELIAVLARDGATTTALALVRGLERRIAYAREKGVLV